MSTSAIDALIPDDERFARFSVDRMAVPSGRITYVARYRGVTFVFHHDDQRWWTVLKIHRGQTVAHFVTTELPSRVRAALPERKPDARRRTP